MKIMFMSAPWLKQEARRAHCRIHLLASSTTCITTKSPRNMRLRLRCGSVDIDLKIYARQKTCI